MCLNKVTKTKNLPKVVYGFKIFKEIKEKKYRSIYFEFLDNKFEINKTEMACTTLTKLSSSYEVGFHVFKDLEFAKNWKSIHGGRRSRILRVSLRELTTIGLEYTYPKYGPHVVYVGKKIRLIREVPDAN